MSHTSLTKRLGPKDSFFASPRTSPTFTVKNFCIAPWSVQPSNTALLFGIRIIRMVLTESNQCSIVSSAMRSVCFHGVIRSGYQATAIDVSWFDSKLSNRAGIWQRLCLLPTLCREESIALPFWKRLTWTFVLGPFGATRCLDCLSDEPITVNTRRWLDWNVRSIELATFSTSTCPAKRCAKYSADILRTITNCDFICFFVTVFDFCAFLFLFCLVF